MAVHFHPLLVKKIERLTDECVSLSFEIPAEIKTFFEFTQGQNITIKAVVEGEELRRSYSICSAPYEDELRVAIKKVKNGQFSCFANDRMKEGMQLEVLSPTGKFNTPLNKTHKKNYVAFAAGSGITPVISIIKTTLATETNSHFTLIYGNRNRASIIFLEELESIKNRYMQRFELINILSRERTDAEINFGRITREKLDALSKLINYAQTDEFFICGPEEMTFGIRDYLLQHQIAEKKIHFELFAAVKKSLPHPSQQTDPDTSTAKTRITLHLDGRNFEFEKELDDSSILDAALKAGADLPFACKGGVCCTCKAKLIEGQVKMDVHWGLEEDELKMGYILTCQSHPLSEKLVIDFDTR